VDLDPHDFVNIPGLDHEGKIHMLATMILLEEGGPLAKELLATPRSDPWELRRAFLKSTLAWSLAEEMLDE
jgi:hypothetical protein